MRGICSSPPFRIPPLLKDATTLTDTAVRRAQKAKAWERTTNTFEAVAGRWFEVWKTEVTSGTAENQWSRLVQHIMPALGALPVSDIVSKILAIRPETLYPGFRPD
ncbi:MAG: hypothetical protein LBC91_00450 [Candidatus Accumulibacter sp.]|jgi:hypothetical protein|nr:hypothetical protein [Accumulibacter sp.]